MFIQPFYFVSYYYVYWIEYDDYFFYFQETYNNRLRETYGDDPSTHPEFDPNLWMKAGSSGGPDKNRVYGLFNTRADNLRTTRTASTVGSSQSVSSSQSKEYMALQQRCDQISEAYTQLKEQYTTESTQQRAAYEELRQMVINMSQRWNMCPQSKLAA